VPLIAAYHRPADLDEALSLLAEPNRIVLAGGTVVNADRVPSDLEVVDLQALGLDGLAADGDRVRIGAMTTLASLSEADPVPAWIRTIARAEAPSTLRSLATVGGTVASGSGESLLLAALLVCDALVELAGAEDRALVDALESGLPAGSVITAVTIDPGGLASQATTSRTPADKPIVAAVARSSNGTTTLALTGVADTPVLVDPTDPGAGLTPPADFRGTTEYRLELARILGIRAVEAVR
jgi:aerobic carbon-monoxide dehydrogenase medium subunit